jgi:hypothetical protein
VVIALPGSGEAPEAERWADAMARQFGTRRLAIERREVELPTGGP